MAYLTLFPACVFVVRLAMAQVDQSCYFPNGTASPDFVPCDPDAEHSACCVSTDECLSNGLCRAYDSDPSSNAFWRDLCTDSTWESDACPKQCYNSSTNPLADTVAYFVAQCSIDTYCCADPKPWAEEGNFYCCSDEDMLFSASAPEWASGPQLQIEAFTQTSSSVSATASSTSSGSATSNTAGAASASATGNQPTAEQSPGSDNTTAIGVGVGVGVGGALLIIAAVGWFFWKRSKKQKEQGSEVWPQQQQSGYPKDAQDAYQPQHVGWTSPQGPAPPQYGQPQGTNPYFSELGAEGGKVEMPAVTGIGKGVGAGTAELSAEQTRPKQP